MNTEEDDRTAPAERDRAVLTARAPLLVRLIMGRWTLRVLAEVSEGGRRYQDLHSALGGISHKVLTDSLRRTERDALVMRHVDPGRVETATCTGSPIWARSLGQPLGALDRWTASHWHRVEAARQQWNQRSE